MNDIGTKGLKGLLAPLNEALKALDEGARRAAGTCPRCGRPLGGLIPAGWTREQAGLCVCAQRQGDEDGSQGKGTR